MSWSDLFFNWLFYWHFFRGHLDTPSDFFWFSILCWKWPLPWVTFVFVECHMLQMYRRLQALFSFSKMVAGDLFGPLQLNCLGCCVLVVLPSYPVCPAKIFTTVGNYRWRYVTCTRRWQGEINNVCGNDYADVVPHFNRLSPNYHISNTIYSFPSGYAVVFLSLRVPQMVASMWSR